MKIKYLLRIWSHLLKKSLMENLQSKRAVKTVIIISVLSTQEAKIYSCRGKVLIL